MRNKLTDRINHLKDSDRLKSLRILVYTGYTRLRFSAARKKILLGVSILILFILGFAFYSRLRYQKSREFSQSPKEAARLEKQAILPKLSRLIKLPEGEQPLIATVVHASKLRQEPFFKDARNGDKIVIYMKARKAILYRPGENKIINFSSLKEK
ncbi:hypothetical protein M1615_01535 [Patescibacteria group bacterium]|nr:hypothetical protein [Patescibacteria group bacterium]MCL5010269.1 hypothetical protein [Patescibacteria group bacterium]